MTNKIALATFTLILSVVFGARADDGFLKIENIQGESVDAAHKGEIDVVAWSWGASVALSTTTTATGLGAGKVTFDTLTIQKKVDAATPLLFTQLEQGARLGTVTLTVRRENAATNAGVDYLTFTMTGVAIASVNISGGGTERADETVQLSFGAYTLAYSPVKPDGTVSKPISSSWNRMTNMPK